VRFLYIFFSLIFEMIGLVVLQFLDKQLPDVELERGDSVVLGRESKISSDRRVSRRHAQVELTSNGRLLLSSLGANPTFILKSGSHGGIQKRRTIASGSAKVLLCHDDVVSLLETECRLRVRIPAEEMSSPASSQTLDPTLVATQFDHTQLVVSSSAETSNPENRSVDRNDDSSAWENSVLGVDADDDDDDSYSGPVPMDLASQSMSMLPDAPPPFQERGRQVHASRDSKRARRDDSSSGNGENKRLRRHGTSYVPVTQINVDEIQFRRTIGSGSCGEVLEARWRGTPVAVKKIFRSLIKKEALDEFRAESRMLQRLSHPSVVQMLGTCERDGAMMIVTEYLARGSLHDVLHNADLELSWARRLGFARDAAAGLHYLHAFNPERTIIHRDIKVCICRFSCRRGEATAASTLTYCL
jgi:Protein tyrosine and serine/threonine kinase